MKFQGQPYKDDSINTMKALLRIEFLLKSNNKRLAYT